LLDQSASMKDPFGGASSKGDAAPSKARALADIINQLLRDLILRCAKDDGIRDYFEVALIGYGHTVAPLISKIDPSNEFDHLIPVSVLANKPLRVDTKYRKTKDDEDRKIRVPVWIESSANNGTPMCRALDMATSMLQTWTQNHMDSFPPIVFNISDGEATDGDPLRFAQILKKVSTDDGGALLFNIHLSGHSGQTVFLPNELGVVQDEFAETLYHMSSRLPFPMRSSALSLGHEVGPDTKGYLYNADPGSLVQFLEIGTRPSNLR